MKFFEKARLLLFDPAKFFKAIHKERFDTSIAFFSIFLLANELLFVAFAFFFQGIGLKPLLGSFFIRFFLVLSIAFIITALTHLLVIYHKGKDFKTTIRAMFYSLTIILMYQWPLTIAKWIYHYILVRGTPHFITYEFIWLTIELGIPYLHYMFAHVNGFKKLHGINTLRSISTLFVQWIVILVAIFLLQNYLSTFDI